jgi:uncharacterized lipoprotein YmbA
MFPVRLRTGSRSPKTTAGRSRWKENFARVLSQNVAAMLHAERIRAYPWSIDKRPVYQVEVELLRFEANTSQAAHLAARWSVRNAGKRDRFAIGDADAKRSDPGSLQEK